MATIADFGIPGVNGAGILHPKHQDRWRVTFNKIGDGTNSNNLSFQAVKIARPKLTFEEIELHRYNSRAWVAGKHNWDPTTLTIEDDVTGSASKIVKAQLQRQKWLIGSDGPWLSVAPEGSIYKFAIILDMLDGGENVIEKWYLEGCFLQAVNYGELDYESANGKVTIEMTVRFDHARQEIGGYASGEGIATGGGSV